MNAGTLTDQLNHRFGGLGSRYAALVISAGHVSVDGAAVNVPSVIIAAGSKIWVGLNLHTIRPNGSPKPKRPSGRLPGLAARH